MPGLRFRHGFRGLLRGWDAVHDESALGSHVVIAYLGHVRGLCPILEMGGTGRSIFIVPARGTRWMPSKRVELMPRPRGSTFRPCIRRKELFILPVGPAGERHIAGHDVPL
jgi:hypothetical protein